MPIYVYEEILPDGSAGEQFEIIQRMSDEPLDVHPDNGKKIRRIPAVASIAGVFSDMKSSKSLSDKNLEAKGFTKYVKTSDGTYEKTVGRGPSQISRDNV